MPDGHQAIIGIRVSLYILFICNNNTCIVGMILYIHSNTTHLVFKRNEKFRICRYLISTGNELQACLPTIAFDLCLHVEVYGHQIPS